MLPVLSSGACPMKNTGTSLSFQNIINNLKHNVKIEFEIIFPLEI